LQVTKKVKQKDGMLKSIATVSIALAISLATIGIAVPTDERAMYGHEGPLEQNRQPRELGGWPTPFLADNPHTSVPHQLGVEDNFRLGSFVGTLSFWILVVQAISGLARRWRSNDLEVHTEQI
jgi:hypothetical protein